MDRATLIKTAAYRMGNIRGQDEAIGLELDLAVHRLEGQDFYPWFLLSENNFYDLSAGENRVPVPPGFLSEYEEGALYLVRDNGQYIPLKKKSQDQLKSLFEVTGEPCAYALTNQYFRVFPVPSEDVKLELLFYRDSATLSVDENPWYTNAAELLIAETCWAMLSARKDQRADYWKGAAAEQYQRLQRKDVERREVNREITFGGDD